MRTTRLLNIFFLLAFLLVGAFAGSYAYQRYEKLEAARSEEALASERLALLQKKTESRRTSLDRLNRDPEYVERIIRQKLNYAKEGEVVFKFEYSDR